MNLVLLGVHYLVFAGAWVAARFNRRFGESNLLVALGLLGVPILGVLTLVLLDPSNHAGNGTTGAWYLIFSVVTLGGVPAVSLASAAVSGVCAFRFYRWVRVTNRPDAAPLASSRLEAVASAAQVRPTGRAPTLVVPLGAWILGGL